MFFFNDKYLGKKTYIKLFLFFFILYLFLRGKKIIQKFTLKLLLLYYKKFLKRVNRKWDIF
jgi:hypothetical protein